MRANQKGVFLERRRQNVRNRTEGNWVGAECDGDPDRQSAHKRRGRGEYTRERPNDLSPATRPAERLDCNSDAMAGFAAAHG